MSKYRNIKIHVPTPEISEAVQKKLFEDGCFWDGSNQHEVKYTDSQYLYVTSRGSMECGDYKSTFVDASEKEVPYQSILDPYYDVKIAWANGEVVQYRPLIMNDHGTLSLCDWKDWERKRDICIRSGEHWRVKPKTKTIKQWERKYLQGDLVMTMIVSGPGDSNNMECWIGEAYEAEYEVPND